MKPKFIPKKLTALISLALLPSFLSAAVVRDDIDYQYFRDFAENKGEFYVNAMNVPIFDKSGIMIGRMLKNAPMIDFSVAERSSGVATLISSQYISSVAHNSGYKEVQFGGQGKNFDAHHFDYKIVDRNDYSGSLNQDYHIPRLHKLVTEVVPIPVSNAGLDANQYSPSSNRFSEYVRVGSGTQYTRSANNHNTYVAGPYSYLIGGNSLDLVGNRYGWFDAVSNLFHSRTGIMATYGLPGDSGSPLFAFDKIENRWVLIGVLNFHSGENASGNVYSISRADYIQEKQEEDIAGRIISTSKDNQFTWHTDSNGRNSTSLSVPLTNAITNSVDISALNAGKSVYFTGHNGTLTLEDNINQGAGALYFDTHFTVKGKNENTTWLGAGVSVAEGKEVKWQVHNPKGDRLSKIGKGILYVNGTGKNEGDISVGDGLVFLNQNADAKGNQQAFNRIGITSGRATVVIVGENQFNPNNLYFGFRGGRLDMNGHSLTFDRIQNVDEGAKIVNNNLDKASTLTIQGIQFRENDIQWQKWGQQATSQLSIYEYPNQWRNYRKDYFQLVGNPGRYYPLDQNSDSNWAFLSSNKQEAINKVLDRYSKYQAFNGFLGETDFSKTNGELNIHYTPRKENQFLLLSGGTELNGTFSVNNGSVLLSGRPTPHARDHLRNRDVERDDDWISRDFNAREFKIHNNSNFYVGRNVSQVNGNITGLNNSTISVGFIQNQTPLCTRSDYSGEINCNNKAILSEAIFNQIPQTQLNSRISLLNNSHFSLGKAHLKGSIYATGNSQVKLEQGSEWTLTTNSAVNNLSMNDSQITLNQQYQNLNSSQIQNGVNHFNELTVVNLSGNGKFNFLSNAGSEHSDKLTITGMAQGTFGLRLKNTGVEPKSAKPLQLISVRNGNNATFFLENHYVDLGAYRYVLKSEQNNYRLYSPVKDAVLGAYSNLPTEQVVNSAVNSAKNSLDRVIALSREIAQKSQDKVYAEHQVARKAREEQIARKKEEDYRNKARWRLLPYRKQEALNIAKKAMLEANNAKNAATEFSALATQREREIAIMKKSLEQAKRKAEEAENLAIKLAFFSSSSLSVEKIVQQAQQLCRTQGIDNVRCNILLDAFELPQELRPKGDVSIKVREVNAKLMSKMQEKERLQHSLSLKDKALFKENQTIKRYKESANRRLFQSRREQDLSFAYQAFERAKNIELEREQLIQSMMILDGEISLLQSSLDSINHFSEMLPASASLDEMFFNSTMLNIDELERQYKETETNFEKIQFTFDEQQSGLSTQELANRKAELEKAKESLQALKDELEQAKNLEAEFLSSLLSARAETVTAPQRELISQYANSALSDSSAQMNSLLHLNQEVHNRLITDSDKVFSVWANYGVMNNQYRSDLFRNYSQHVQLNQLGVENNVAEDTYLGAIFSQSRSKNKLDDGFNGKARLNMLTLYAKTELGYGVTGAVDLSYGQSKNRIYQGRLETDFKSHIYQAGLTLAKKWDWNGFSIQPALTARYQHFSGNKYDIELARIEHKPINIVSYGASIKLAKTFELNGVKLIPSWQSQYTDASRRDFSLNVNGEALKQRFGRYAQHQFELAMKLKNWDISANLGLLNGNQAKHHKFARLNIGYSW